MAAETLTRPERNASRRPVALIIAVTMAGLGLVVGPASAQTVTYRVNAGGAAVTGTPQWSADTSGSPSSFVNAAATGNKTYSTSNTINMTHASIPSGTPQTLFQTERWDPGGSPEMQWDFPVAPGAYEVRLYFAEIYSGAQSPGARVFGVSIESNVVLNNYDVFADVGGYKAVMKSFNVTSDGTLDIDFTHQTENPAIKAIEILGDQPPAQIGFGKSSLKQASSAAPTSLQFGPDGRLYVAQFDGTIKIYSIGRSGANDYTVSTTETINLIRSIPNHDDDGTLNPGLSTRLITGMLVVGTASAPIIYVSSSDPRIGGGSSGTDLNLDTNSSMISRVTWNGSQWSKTDVVRGLPRSEENHAANGLVLDAAANTLYVAMGGNTNKGATSNNFAYLPEFALSAAILSVDLGAIGNTTYDLPTLNDEDRPGTNDANDPFGGNDGKNQAKLVPGGPVQIHAPGFRNAYDLVVTQAGRMYTIDNGGNAGWGDVPINEGPAGTCTNGVKEPGTSDGDGLHLVTGPGYYGGHPNPTRGNTSNTFNASNPQSPVPSANAIECDYRKPGSVESPTLTTWPASTNGIAEYTASNFGGEMQGDLIAAGYNSNAIQRIQLNGAGTVVTSNTTLFSTVGTKPLDVVAQGNSGPFPGTIWVADINGSEIWVFEPNDFSGGGGGCTGAYDPTLDEDSDGFDNADEIDNGTNPCSAADVPPDWDQDGTSNLNDPDDDNDGAPDTSDAFAIDPNDGLSTSLPVQYTWENDAPNPGGLLGLGFTGLMTNGTANYESLFDLAKMTAGGAAGVVTVDEASEGTATGSTNTQEYGFQFGVKADAATVGPFTVHTSILAPFAGITPQDEQSMGLYIGNGDQNNYAKIVVHSNAGVGGIKFLKEIAGAVSERPQDPVTMPGPDFVDLYLTVDPAAATVQPAYRVTTGGSTGPVTPVGSPEPVPAGWFDGSSGLAVGIISTSAGPAPPFPATWDLIEVLPESGTPGPLAQDDFGRVLSNGWGVADAGGAWTLVAGTSSNFGVNGDKGTVVIPSNRQEQLIHLPGTSALNVDYRARITFPKSPPSGGYFGYLLLRRQAGGAYYRVGIRLNPSGKVLIRGQTNAQADLFPDFDTGLTSAPGDTFIIRVQAQGTSPTTLRAKVWRQGSSEPGSWLVQTTDSTTAMQNPGSLGVRAVNTSSSTTTLSFDGLLAELL